MFRLQRGSVGCLALLWLSWALLAACRSGAQPRTALEPAAVATATPPAMATATPEPLAIAPTATATPATAEPTSAATTPTPTATLSSAETDLALGHAQPGAADGVPPTPRLTPVPCPTRSPDAYVPLMWERSGPLPLDTSLSTAHTAFRPPHDFFIGVENQVGYIRLDEPALLTTDPFSILVYGFDEIPDLPPITDIEAPGDELLYLTGGSRLTVVHAGDPCYLVPLATADFPFPAQHVELEDEHIYVGGSDGQQLHIAVLDRTALPEVRQLAALTFPPGVWSVVGDQLLTHESPSAAVTVTDVSDFSTPVSRLVQLPLDPEWDAIGPAHLVNDAFSLLIRNRGVVSISRLLEPEQAVQWHPVQDDFMLGGHLAQELQLLIIENFSDMGSGSSTIHVARRDNQQGFVSAHLYPHYPVYSGYAISDDVVFAFSDYSLLVIDLTAPEGQEVVRTYPLRWGLD